MGVVGAMLSNSALDHLKNYDYKRLFRSLAKAPTTQLNEDLDQLIKESVVQALRNTAQQYKKGLREEHHLEQLDELLSKLIEQVERASNQGLLSNHVVIDHLDGLSDEDPLDELIAGFDQLPDIGLFGSFPEFLKNKFPSNLEICFSELLRDSKNHGALVIYQRNMTRAVQQNIQKVLLNQNALQEDFEISQDTNEAIRGELEKLSNILNETITLESIVQAIDQQLSLKLHRIEEQLYQVGHDIQEGVREISDKIDQQGNHQNILLDKFLGVSPFNTDLFIGREEDLTIIRQKLISDNNLLLLVNGEGGIGKTTLAAQYYYRYQEDYTHLAWIFAGKGLVDGLLSLARSLHISVDTEDTDQTLNALMNRMRQLPQPCLLVIDNANRVDELEQRYTILRSCPNLHVLITTRITELEHASRHQVLSLSDEDAETLFKKHYPNHNESEDNLLRQLLVAVGKNTLVVELLAKNLNVFNRIKEKYTLDSLLSDLSKKGLFGIQRRQINTSYLTEGKALRKEESTAIIEAMYDLNELPSQEQILLAIISVLPSETIPFNTLESILHDVKDADETLYLLYQKGWLEWNREECTFKASPVVQEVVRKKSDNLFASCGSLLVGLMKKLEYERSTGQLINSSYEAAATYARYAEYLLDTLENVDNGIAALYELTANYYKTVGYSQKALTLFIRAKIQSKKLCLANPKKPIYKRNYAVLYEKIGGTYDASREPEKALDHYLENNRLCKELYNDHPQHDLAKRDYAVSCSVLGQALLKIDHKEAFQYIKKENDLFKELADVDPFGLSVSYEKLGEYHLSDNNPTDALKCFEEVYKILLNLEVDPSSQAEIVKVFFALASSCQRIARTLLKIKNSDIKRILLCFSIAEKTYKKLNTDHPKHAKFKRSLAVLYEEMDRLYQRTEALDLDKALEYRKKANSLFEELHALDLQDPHHAYSLVSSYMNFAKLHEKMENPKKAKNSYEEVTRLLTELTEHYPNNNEYQSNLRWINEQLSRL